MKQKIINVLILIQMFLVCGCSNKELIYHGYTFNDVNNLEIKLEEFKKTKAPKENVMKTLGSPTFMETLQNESNHKRSEFFYVENIFIRKPFIGDKKIETKVLKITFDYNDQVQDFQLYKTNKADVFDSSIQTKVKGNEMKFFEQMKKNLTSISK